MALTGVNCFWHVPADPATSHLTPLLGFSVNQGPVQPSKIEYHASGVSFQVVCFAPEPTDIMDIMGPNYLSSLSVPRCPDNVLPRYLY